MGSESGVERSNQDYIKDRKNPSTATLNTSWQAAQNSPLQFSYQSPLHNVNVTTVTIKAH